MAKELIHLIDQSTWRRNELASSGVEIRHSFGLDIPNFNSNDGWWAPQEPFVRLNYSLKVLGRETIKVSAPGPQLLVGTPEDYLQRKVEVFTVEEAQNSPKTGWWKAAEAKIESFPAERRTSEKLLQDLTALPKNTILHFTGTELDIAKEYRSYILGKKVVTTSTYLVNSDEGNTKIVYDGLEHDPVEIEKVSEFADTVASQIVGPATYVLDTVVLADGSLAVLEYNPTWCSAWYDNDVTKVAQCILAATVSADDSFLYQPDVYMVKKTEQKRVLR